MTHRGKYGECGHGAETADNSCAADVLNLGVTIRLRLGLDTERHKADTSLYLAVL